MGHTCGLVVSGNMNRNIVVIINGAPKSGKDTFVRQCRDIDEQFNVTNLSLADHYKEYMVKNMGWDRRKTKEARNLLAALIEYDWSHNKCKNVIVEMCNAIRQKAEHKNKINVTFIHCRQPYIISHIIDKCTVALYGVEVHTLLVSRALTEFPTNDADRCVNDYNYDHVVYNDGTVEDLHDRAVNYMMDFIGR